MKVLELYKKIKDSTEVHKKKELRYLKKVDIDTAPRQGDIYIHRVKDDFPHGKLLQNNQLAHGNTKGSRHIAESPSEVFDGKQAPKYLSFEGNSWPLIGPFVKSLKRFSISHPEHADISLPPGCYQITHQMDARTRMRVQD